MLIEIQAELNIYLKLTYLVLHGRFDKPRLLCSCGHVVFQGILFAFEQNALSLANLQMKCSDQSIFVVALLPCHSRSKTSGKF